jgi:peptide/nickel transport system substrate-binding protein
MKKKSGLSKLLTVIIALVIIVSAITAVIYAISGPLSISVSIATSTNVGTARTSISFTALPSVSGARVINITWNFGDGTNQTTSGPTTTHTYANGGFYLVLAKATISYQNIFRSYSTTVSNNLALFPLEVQSNLTLAQSAEAAVPTINFPASLNPKAPVFSVGDTVYPVGGFLEAPSNMNWTIKSYNWSFANGNPNAQVQSNSTTGLPSRNVTTSYSQTGLYPLSLTLTTTNSTGGSFSVTTVHTLAVQSSILPFAILVTKTGVINPNVITATEVAPGGPISFDPQISYDFRSLEVLLNIFQTLVAYNGSSTSSFIPAVAAALPSQQNGGISSDFKTYNFTIRSNQYFSNGDKVTAYDVWYSMVRDMAFTAGAPGTPDWILAQFIIPGVNNGTGTIYTDNGWANVTNAITYSNSSNTVAFHFNRAMPSSLVFQVLADENGAGIIDARYAASVGAGFSQSNWNSYMNQGNGGSYNTKMQWSPVGSGPYMIQSYVPGQSIELAPNPRYMGVPGIPPVNKTVLIEWVKTPDIALLMLEDGQADSATGLPPSDFPLVQQLQAKGLLHIYNFPTLTEWWYSFNIDINKSMEASQIGPGYNEPYNYFADLPTRLAFVNSFDYQGYLNNILGNAKYGATLGIGFQGIIPQGMAYWVPPSQLGGLPTQNLNDARGNFSISAWHDTKINLPIIIQSGDPTELAAAQDYASILNQMSGGNITAQVVAIPFTQEVSYFVPKQDPMGVYWDTVSPDYPDPSDYVDLMYLQGGFVPAGNNWVVSNFVSMPPANPNGLVHVNGSLFAQDKVYSWINGNVSLGDTSTDPNVRQRAYKIAEELAIDMGLIVYVYQVQQFWFFRSWLGGYQYQENPMLGGVGDLLYFWLTKG